MRRESISRRLFRVKQIFDSEYYYVYLSLLIKKPVLNVSKMVISWLSKSAYWECVSPVQVLNVVTDMIPPVDEFTQLYM